MQNLNSRSRVICGAASRTKPNCPTLDFMTAQGLTVFNFPSRVFSRAMRQDFCSNNVTWSLCLPMSWFRAFFIFLFFSVYSESALTRVHHLLFYKYGARFPWDDFYSFFSSRSSLLLFLGSRAFPCVCNWHTPVSFVAIIFTTKKPSSISHSYLTTW